MWEKILKQLTWFFNFPCQSCRRRAASRCQNGSVFVYIMSSIWIVNNKRFMFFRWINKMRRLYGWWCHQRDSSRVQVRVQWTTIREWKIEKNLDWGGCAHLTNTNRANRIRGIKNNSRWPHRYEYVLRRWRAFSEISQIKKIHACTKSCCSIEVLLSSRLSACGWWILFSTRISTHLIANCRCGVPLKDPIQQYYACHTSTATKTYTLEEKIGIWL